MISPLFTLFCCFPLLLDQSQLQNTPVLHRPRPEDSCFLLKTRNSFLIFWMPLLHKRSFLCCHTAVVSSFTQRHQKTPSFARTSPFSLILIGLESGIFHDSVEEKDLRSLSFYYPLVFRPLVVFFARSFALFLLSTRTHQHARSVRKTEKESRDPGQLPLFGRFGLPHPLRIPCRYEKLLRALRGVTIAAARATGHYILPLSDLYCMWPQVIISLLNLYSLFCSILKTIDIYSRIQKNQVFCLKLDEIARRSSVRNSSIVARPTEFPDLYGSLRWRL